MRVKALSDVPSISDTVPGYAVTGWLGIGAPKGTSAEIVEKLNKDINAAVSDPEIAARLASFGSDPFTELRRPISANSSRRKRRNGKGGPFPRV